jgi:Fur family ferric uptake transcriptional regulator
MTGSPGRRRSGNGRVGFDMTKQKRVKKTMTQDDARLLLQETGLRRTASRVAVLCELANSAAPVTHAEVADRLDKSGFGAPTIFRCLCDLTEVGLAIRTDLGDHVWRFGFRGHHAEDADHPHFVCLDCGAATCLPELNVRITQTEQQEIGDVTEVVLKGHCPNCR